MDWICRVNGIRLLKNIDKDTYRTIGDQKNHTITVLAETTNGQTTLQEVHTGYEEV